MRPALADEVVAVVGQQAHLLLGPDEPRHGQVRLAQRRTRHALGIDRVALAVAARRGARLGHQLGRHAHQALTTGQQVALEAAGRRGGSPRARSSARDPGRGPRRRAPRSRRPHRPTVVSPRLRPLAPSTATAAWLFICGSIPITIMRSPPLVGCSRSRVGTAGGHALVGPLGQAPIRSRRRPLGSRRRRTKQLEVSPSGRQNALWVTPPSGPRLPEAPQGSHGERVTPRYAC